MSGWPTKEEIIAAFVVLYFGLTALFLWLAYRGGRMITENTYCAIREAWFRWRYKAPVQMSCECGAPIGEYSLSHCDDCFWKQVDTMTAYTKIDTAIERRRTG